MIREFKKYEQKSYEYKMKHLADRKIYAKPAKRIMSEPAVKKMNSPLKKENTSLEGFEQLWEAPEHSQSIDSISNQIHAILKVLVDERIALNQEHQLVSELKQHIDSLETQIQKLNWQLGQREHELSNLYSEHHEVKSTKETLEKNATNHKELIQENTEIRLLAEQLSNQILQEKSKNEQLVELLMNLSNPDLAKVIKKFKD